MLILMASACATRKAPPIAPAAPLYPDFVFPAVVASEAASLAPAQDAAWRTLQSGDVRGAERQFTALLRKQPRFVPAEAGLGYVALARKQAADAVTHFDRAVKERPQYAPALVGRAQALVALGRDTEALASYEAAAAADPSLDLGSRIAVLRFRGAGSAVTEAREAAEKGQIDRAREAYTRAIAASPDSAFLYRELGSVETRAGNVARALELYRRAASLDPGDARSHVLAGDLLMQEKRFDEAAREYGAALALEPSPDIERKAAEAHDQAQLATLPPEYQVIATSPDVTRGDVAAVLGVRLAPWLAEVRARPGVLLTDIRGHWAAPWILTVVRSGVMEPFPNHTFQPALRVRRSDLAQIVARALALVAERRDVTTAAWQGVRVAFSDVPPTHPLYSAIAQAVGSGVMLVAADSAFQPAGPVTGADLIGAVRRLEALFGRPPARR